MIAFDKAGEFLLRIPLPVLIFLFVFVTVTLFSSDQHATLLGLADFRTEYRKFIGPTWLVLMAFICGRVWAEIALILARRKSKKMRIESLSRLTAEEKGCLSEFIFEGKNTIYAYHGDGVANGLIAKRILYRAANAFTVTQGMPCNLQEWARKHLETHPELLDGADGRHQSGLEGLGLGNLRP